MPAYIVIEIEIHNPELYEEYRKLASPTLAPYDGLYVVRGGKTELLEGDKETARIVILEFTTMEKAKQWWNSDEYAPAKAVRHKSANENVHRGRIRTAIIIFAQ